MRFLKKTLLTIGLIVSLIPNCSDARGDDELPREQQSSMVTRVVSTVQHQLPVEQRDAFSDISSAMPQKMLFDLSNAGLDDEDSLFTSRGVPSKFASLIVQGYPAGVDFGKLVSTINFDVDPVKSVVEAPVAGLRTSFVVDYKPTSFEDTLIAASPPLVLKPLELQFHTLDLSSASLQVSGATSENMFIKRKSGCLDGSCTLL